MTFRQALEVLAAVYRRGVDCVVVGGIAMALHGIVRATEDLDLFVRATPENLDRIRQALGDLYDDPEIELITVGDLAGEFSVVRYGPPGVDYVIDLIARLGEAFDFDDIESQAIDVDGVTVTVATPAMLYRMKRDTVRPQDRADAAELQRRFGLTDGGG
ncbi:MAG: nucleotidyl transferase AbiEii/AbiGii toxin family protein [Egibacteraceae bacterium]